MTLNQPTLHQRMRSQVFDESNSLLKAHMNHSIAKLANIFQNKWPQPLSILTVQDRILNTDLLFHIFCKFLHPHQQIHGTYDHLTFSLASISLYDRQVSFFISKNFTTDNELGIPVSNPDARTKLIGRVYASSSSYIMYSSQILKSIFLISSLDPNCKETWAPIPNNGDRVPILQDTKYLCKTQRLLLIYKSS